MSKTIEEIIKEVGTKRISNAPNYSIEAVKEIAERYAKSKSETIKHLVGVNSELKKQNKDLVEMLEAVLYSQHSENRLESSVNDDIKFLLTKYPKP